MSWQETYNVEYVLPELEKMKRFFENSIKDNRPDSVHGCYGHLSTFFGNVIQHCEFDIPASAMKLIYEYNKENIEKQITNLTELKEKLELCLN